MAHDSTLPGVLVASISAGPIFTTATTLALAYGMLPASVAVSELALLAWMFGVTVGGMIGLFLALIPNLLGSAALARLGEAWPEARAPLLWVVTGAALAGIVALAFGADNAAGFGLVVTGAANAGLCRRGLRWADDEEGL